MFWGLWGISMNLRGALHSYRNFNLFCFFILLQCLLLLLGFVDFTHQIYKLPPEQNKCYKFGLMVIKSDYFLFFFCLVKPGILHGSFQVAIEKSPSPPVPATQLSPDSGCWWKYFSRPNKATNPHTHTLPKIRPNPYSAACKEPCQSLATLGLKHMPFRTLLSIGVFPAQIHCAQFLQFEYL